MMMMMINMSVRVLQGVKQAPYWDALWMMGSATSTERPTSFDDNLSDKRTPPNLADGKTIGPLVSPLRHRFPHMRFKLRF